MLAPWTIAPHPNFSEKPSRSSQFFAMACANPLERTLRATPEFEFDWERTLVGIARDQGVRIYSATDCSRLAQISSDRNVPPGARAAATIFASIGFSNRGDLTRAQEVCIDALKPLLDVPDPTTAIPEDENLVTAAIRQQLALRLMEAGERVRASVEAERVELICNETNEEGFEGFKTSKGISWGFQRVLSDINDALKRHALGVQVDSDLWNQGKSRWKDFIRSRRLEIDSRVELREAQALQNLLGDNFRADFEDATTRVKFSSRDSTLVDLEAALLMAEASGDLHEVISRRRALGLYLAMGEFQDSASLIRGAELISRSGDKESLDLLLQRVRANGPLRTLSELGQRALARLEGGPLRRLELDLVCAASEVLPRNSLIAAIRFAYEYSFQKTEPGLGASQPMPWSRKDIAWRAICDLLPGSGLDNWVAERALADLNRSDASDSLLVRRIVQVVETLDWPMISSSTLRTWERWASHDGLDGELLALQAAVRDALGLDNNESLADAVERDGLRASAAVLNEHYRGRSIEPGELELVVSSCVDALRKTRQRAPEHFFSLNAISESDLSSAVLVAFPDEVELWQELTAYLLDPSVAIHDKSPALDRLAQSKIRLPSEVRDAISDKIDSLMRGEGERSPLFEESAHSINAPAVRFATTFNLAPREKTISFIAVLASSSDVRDRVESIGCLANAANTDRSPEWAGSMLLQLSNDPNASVRAEAGNALVRFVGRLGAVDTASRDRVYALLKSDGLVEPLMLIRGLITRSSQRVEPADELIVSRIEEMRQTHASRSVRGLASQLIDLWSVSLSDPR